MPDGPRTLIRGKRPIWNSALIATCCGDSGFPVGPSVCRAVVSRQ